MSQITDLSDSSISERERFVDNLMNTNNFFDDDWILVVFVDASGAMNSV